MEKSIRVPVLGREYALRVDEDSEALTREIAASVDEKMRVFRRAHPDQPKLTAAVVVALSLAENLHRSRNEQTNHARELDVELGELADQLASALPPGSNASDEDSDTD